MRFIDTDNYEAAGIETFFFPGGEPHANVYPVDDDEVVHIFAKLRTWEDVGRFLAVTNTLIHQAPAVLAYMPYFPGARQDRNVGETTPLTVAMYAGLFTHLRRVTVVDIHSDRAADIISRRLSHGAYREMNIDRSIVAALENRPDFILVPDKGAVDRASRIAAILDVPVVSCEKTRDFATGKLSGFKVPDVSMYQRGLIVDDICDGGGTFLGIAAEVDNQYDPPFLDLFVTHGIFSKGVDVIGDVFDHVYTTDSFYQETTPVPWITVIHTINQYLGGFS